MTRPSRALRTAAVIGAASLALAACGSDSGSGASTESTDAATPAVTESATEDTAAPAASGDGELVIGTLLPQTGSLAFLGPPEFAGVQLAIDDINAAGGVLGQDVQKIDSDSGDTSTDIASQSVDRLLGEDVDAIVGAASSAVSFTVIDTVTQNGVLMISPANTSPDFTDYDDNGLYFRTAPSDVLQGRVMGDLVVSDGFLDVAILALDDPYGTGLADNVEQAITEGGGNVVESIIYDPRAANFGAEVSTLAAAAPEAVVLIGFDESLRVIPELIAQGIGPDTAQLYLVDGNTANYEGDFPEGALEGTKGTLPGADIGDEFRERLLEVDPDLTEFSYAAESYDATVLVALAAIAAGDDSGESIAFQMANVSRDGEACTTFADCAELLEAGTDIDYEGLSGPIEFDENGDPTEASIGIYEYGPDNNYTNVDYVAGSI